MTAGMFLESSLMADPQDMLAMRLAQDCYLEAGSSENALGCALSRLCVVVFYKYRL